MIDLDAQRNLDIVAGEGKSHHQGGEFGFSVQTADAYLLKTKLGLFLTIMIMFSLIPPLL